MKSSVSTTEIAVGPDRGYQLRGSALDQRLCLIHWLRRALRCSPQFVEGDFAPAPAARTGGRCRPGVCAGRGDRCLRTAAQPPLRCARPPIPAALSALLRWQNRLRQHPRFDAVQRDWLRQSRSSRPPPGCIRPATGCLTSRRRQTSAIFWR